MIVADPALVDHRAVIGHLDRLADAGFATLHYAQLVCCVVYTQGCNLVTWEPLPCPLVVKEEHQVQSLVDLLLPLLPQPEDIFGWDRDGHPVVQQALLWHLWVDDQSRIGGVSPTLGPNQFQRLQLRLILRHLAAVASVI